jgi:N-methylhydantoinase B
VTKGNVDPGTVEIIRNALQSIVMEMKVTIMRSAFSSTIQEAQDFSVALFEKDRMIAQGDTIPAHTGSCYLRIKSILEKFPAGKLDHGDVIMMNDPYFGGTHTPDMSFLKCIKMGDMVFLPLAYGHWSDVGGMTPGSISGSTSEIYQEGILIPPVKLYEKGKLNQAVMDIVLNNVRLPLLRAGDTRTQVAACDLAESRLKEVTDRFGLEVLKEAIETVFSNTEERMRTRIKDIPDGVYEYEDYIDSDGHVPEPLRMHVKVTVEGTNITFDFTGTSKQARGPTNANPAITWSGICLALKYMLDPFWALNDGFYRPINVIIPKGTFLNPYKPAPTGSCWEICSRMDGLVTGALADVVPRVGAGDDGAVNHTYIGGVHPKTGEPYVWYEYPMGGFGATPHNDGCDSVTPRVGGDTRDYPVERAEAEFPLLCTKYEQRIDSGGPGKFRGGLGLRRDMVVLDDERHQRIGLSTIWDRSLIPPYGLAGGFSSAAQRVAVTRSDGTLEYVPVELGTKCSQLPVHKGDRISMRTGGGGGFGDPLDRDPERVLKDLRQGAITEPVAVDVYGVMIDKKRWVVDTGATHKQREKIRQSRIYCTVVPKEGEEFIGNRRAVRVYPELLNLLSVGPGGLIEMVGKAMAPLRAWTIPDQTYSDSKIGLDKTVMRMLKVSEADKVWVRDPNWAVKYVIKKEEEER